MSLYHIRWKENLEMQMTVDADSPKQARDIFEQRYPNTGYHFILEAKRDDSSIKILPKSKK